MKKIIILLLVLAVGGAGWLVVRSLTGGQKAITTLNPYTLEAMRKREYKTQIRILNEVRRSDKFASYKIEYDSDGLKEYALMIVPTGQSPVSGWPVVIVNHGHIPPEQYSTENSYINTSAYFADAGFLVLKPDYRGHDKSEGEAQGLLSRIEYAVDVLNLMAGIPNLREHADENRIYMYGHSMGGEVTLRVLETSDKIKAATLWAPAVTTFPESFLYFARKNPSPYGRVEQSIAELTRNIPEGMYSQVDTLANISRVKVPVNIQHSTTDEAVPYAWGQALAKKFSEMGKEVNFYSYPNDNHDIAGHWVTALSRDVELFSKN